MIMRKKLLSVVTMLSMAIASLADNVNGITVEYLDSHTAAYVQAISAIGRIQFANGKATIIFKDSKAGTYDLGSISAISRLSFGQVNENDITNDNGTQTDIADTENKIIVTAYPNPTADRIHISGIPDSQTIRLFTSDGRLVLVSQQPDIELGTMPSGIYLLQAGKDIIKVIKK